VKGATFEGGLLKIELMREVPEAMKPRHIQIGSFNDNSRSSTRERPDASAHRVARQTPATRRPASQARA
jgi:hypothetical protein